MRIYDSYELLSALQKAVRRGLEDDAKKWGCKLYSQSNSEAGQAFSMLVTIASEDIGLADPMAVIIIHDAYSHWLWGCKNKRPDHDFIQEKGRLFFMHALLVAVRAKKSRLVDYALIVAFESPWNDADEVPDYALDIHTCRGFQMGRGVDWFFKYGATLANEDTSLGDVYKEQARQIRLMRERIKKAEKTLDKLGIEY